MHTVVPHTLPQAHVPTNQVCTLLPACYLCPSCRLPCLHADEDDASPPSASTDSSSSEQRTAPAALDATHRRHMYSSINITGTCQEEILQLTGGCAVLCGSTRGVDAMLATSCLWRESGVVGHSAKSGGLAAGCNGQVSLCDVLLHLTTASNICNVGCLATAATAAGGHEQPASSDPSLQVTTLGSFFGDFFWHGGAVRLGHSTGDAALVANFMYDQGILTST